ncbi:MAG TPA: YciI family protein [Gemmatimonadaceae bacterium]|nr:YciI family protein [Gemmatimonadaceae bacterium]
MRVLALWYPEGDISAPTQDTMQKMGAFIQEAVEAGVLLDTGGWNPDAAATVITRKKGNVVVKDGPYTEAKEVIGGYAVMRFTSQADLVAWSTRFVNIAGDGRSVVRAIADEPMGH